jgi:excinuclease UvrABC nuclease subunit
MGEGDIDIRFDGSLAVTPPLDEAALRSIPAKRGVFLLSAADGRPILLTTAADMRGRLRFRLAPSDDEAARTRTADLREITAVIRWKLAHSPFETDWRFFELAREIFPAAYSKLIAHKPAWFIRVDASEAFPRFSPTQDVRPGEGGQVQQFGPLPSRASADRFIDALTDAFDLCRYYNILRQAPHGTPCPYKQMGRSPAACDGSIPMEQYRDMIRTAAGFAGGQREAHRQRLAEQMRSAAAAMEFERAGTLKSRLERLGDFGAPQFAFVRPLAANRFVIVQAGPSGHQLSTFCCDRGAMTAGPVLEVPLEEAALQGVLEACDALATEHNTLTLADRQRLGLVTDYLFAAPQKRGLILWRDDLPGPDALREAIAPLVEALGVRPLKRRGKAKGDAPPAES